LLPRPNASTSCPELVVNVEINFAHKGLPKSWFGLQNTMEEFMIQVSDARTFTFADEIQALQKAGLAKGGSLENAVVFSDGSPLNEGGLR